MSIYIGRNGEQLGIFNKDDLKAAVEQGRILLSDLAWSEGESSWVALSEYAAKNEIALSTQKPSTPPPMPPQPQVVQAQPEGDLRSAEINITSKLACPKCQSENTKTMSHIIRFGTRERDIQIGLKHGSVTETDPTAEELSKGLEDAIAGKPGGSSETGWYWFALIVSAFSGVFTWAFLQKHIGDTLSTAAGWAVGIFVVIFLVKKINKNIINSKENTVSFNSQKKWLDNGCVCQRCGERFIPGSNEQYNFKVF